MFEILIVPSELWGEIDGFGGYLATVMMSSQLAERYIYRDPFDPCIESSIASKRADFFMNAEECLLDGVVDHVEIF